MSGINSPLHREPVEIDVRAMTPGRRARIIARDDGHCRYPECEVATGLEIDHIVALELGGKDRDENLQTLCHDHHKAKTKLDATLIAKARRRKAKHDGTFPESKAKIRSPGFRPTRDWSERDA